MDSIQRSKQTSSKVKAEIKSVAMHNAHEVKPLPATPVETTRSGPRISKCSFPPSIVPVKEDEDGLYLRYKLDRQACLEQLRNELQLVGQDVLARCHVSGPEDKRIEEKSGMLIVCKPPCLHFGNVVSTPFIWLFVDATQLIRAWDSISISSNSRMEQDVKRFFQTISTQPAGKDSPHRLPCELDSYSFEAVSCLVYDFFRSAAAGNGGKQPKSTVPEKAASRVRQASSSNTPAKPKAKKMKKLEDAENLDSSWDDDEDDANDQQRQVLLYNEAYDYGQDWWAPKDSQSYRRMFSNLRVDPFVAEPVYELARAFGRQQLELDSEKPMVWEWGAEVRRLPWSIPCFTWLLSKLTVACDYGNTALQNYLLIYLEKNSLGLTEALTLYEFVAAAPVIAMYVERELTQRQMEDAGAVEWILSELQLCETSKNKLVYTTTLANAIMLRVACVRPRGVTFLRTAIREAEGRCKAKRSHTLVTYIERFPRILLLADAKAQFTIEISDSGVPDARLLGVLRAATAGNRAKMESDIESMDGDSSVYSSSAKLTRGSTKLEQSILAESSSQMPGTSRVSFTFNLCRSSTEFAVELTRALNIAVKESRGSNLMPAVDMTSSQEGDERDEMTPMRSRLRRPSSYKSDGSVSKANLVPERDCKFINWQYVELKQVPSEVAENCVSSSISSPSYQNAMEFHPLPYVYMPSEELINLRTFRRNMPLDHPMVCMLLHALYDNDDFNMLSQTNETILLETQNKLTSGRGKAAPRQRAAPSLSLNESLFHYQVRLTANSVSQLFSRQWKLQGDHRPAVILDLD